MVPGPLPMIARPRAGPPPLGLPRSKLTPAIREAASIWNVPPARQTARSPPAASAAPIAFLMLAVSTAAETGVTETQPAAPLCAAAVRDAISATRSAAIEQV